MEFKYITDEDGDTVECESCCYQAKLALISRCGIDKNDEPMKLCEVCCGTFISTITTSYTHHYEDATRKLAMSMGYIANMILDEVRKNKPNQGS